MGFNFSDRGQGARFASAPPTIAAASSSAKAAPIGEEIRASEQFAKAYPLRGTLPITQRRLALIDKVGKKRATEVFDALWGAPQIAFTTGRGKRIMRRPRSGEPNLSRAADLALFMIASGEDAGPFIRSQVSPTIFHAPPIVKTPPPSPASTAPKASEEKPAPIAAAPPLTPQERLAAVTKVSSGLHGLARATAYLAERNSNRQ